MKGEIIQRSEADVLSEEDDGLAREEKRLAGFGIDQLKQMMDSALEDGELRTPHTPLPTEEGGGMASLLLSETSSTLQSTLSSSSDRLPPGISPRTPGGSSSIDRALQDFQVGMCININVCHDDER